MSALLLTAALLASLPEPALVAMLSQLDSPQFRTRQAAEARLRRGLTHELAACLADRLPSMPPEPRHCVGRILDEYWRAGLPAPEAMPHIDALSNPFATGCSCPLTEAYLYRAKAEFGLPDRSLLAYRLATSLLVEDLIRRRARPAAIRGLLLMMDERTRAWEARDAAHNGGWRRMPIGFWP